MLAYSFRSPLKAMEALNIIEKEGLNARLVSTPPQIETSCGFVLLVQENRVEEFIEKSNVTYSKKFRKEGNLWIEI